MHWHVVPSLRSFADAEQGGGRRHSWGVQVEPVAYCDMATVVPKGVAAFGHLLAARE